MSLVDKEVAEGYLKRGPSQSCLTGAVTPATRSSYVLLPKLSQLPQLYQFPLKQWSAHFGSNRKESWLWRPHIACLCFPFFLSVPFRNVKCLLSLPAVHAKPRLQATFCRPLLSSIQRALQAVLESILVVCLCTAPAHWEPPPFHTPQVTERDLIYLTLGKELGSPSFRLGTFYIGFLSCLQGDRTGSKIK